MNRTREKFNAKARQSAAGSHKKKGQRRSAATDVDSDQTNAVENSNAEILEHKSKEQKDVERREKLRQELAADSDKKMSSKKKRRLEKYIDKKLQKEERLAIFEKLSKSQAELPSLKLQSSATLGTGKTSSNQQLLDKHEDKEVRKLIDGRSGKRKRQNESYTVDSGSDEDNGLIESEKAEEAGFDHTEDEHGSSRQKPLVIVDSGFSTSEVQSAASVVPNVTVVGSALRRNNDGSVTAPKVVKRKAKKLSAKSWLTRSHPPPQASDESETSFDSSDSAYDESDAEEEMKSADGSNGDHESEESDSDRESHPSDKPESEEDGEGDTTLSGFVTNPAKRKRGGFKEWAMKQLSTAKEYVAPMPDSDNSELKPELESQSPTEATIVPPAKKRRLDGTSSSSTDGLLRGPLGEDLQFPNTSLIQQLQPQKQAGTSEAVTRTKFVSVKRSPEIQEVRLQLPVVAEEQPIMEAILLNPVVIICGETGSGKTTQVPQFLYEAGFGSPGSENPGMIGVTQPRRVAAIAMASRVAQELSLPSSRISYQIRYDASVSLSTSIKFMTDGVLLRELATDFLLSKYSIIIIDEAHERNVNTDILIGVLSRVLKLREDMWNEGKEGLKPLRLVIMSATLRVSDFAENKTLFPTTPPVIHVAARQHPVTIHFNRRTPSDYVTEAIRKVVKIHVRLPPGGILIFLTGQNEITGVCKKLEERFGRRALDLRKKKRQAIHESVEAVRNAGGNRLDASLSVAPALVDVEAEDMELGVSDRNLALDVDEDGGEVDDGALESDDENEEDDLELGIDTEETEAPMHIVPLYSLLPSDRQMRVFMPPPAGTRLVVVATNVAETSLTIPGIRYVVDCGRAKERRYEISNGIQTFQVNWISKAAAGQRSGRAGRTGPGHCYRLYSSALYENYFPQFAEPEILRMPIEGVVLQMKSMHIDTVTNFPFPTPPDRTALRNAETLLTHLGALTTQSTVQKTGVGVEVFTSTVGGRITELGKMMALFPLSPRYSRMLVSGRQHGCLPYVIAIVSALSVGDPYLREEALGNMGEENDAETDTELSHLNSEAVKAKEKCRVLRKAFYQSQHTHGSLGNFCSDVFRILSAVGAYEFAGGGQKFCSNHFVRPKAMEEIHKLRTQISNIVQANFPDVDVGFSSDLRPPTSLQIKVLRQLLCAAFIDQVAVRKELVEKDSSTGTQCATSRSVPYRALGVPEDVFIHPSSVLATESPPDCVVFNELVRTSRIYVKGLTVVNLAWLSSLGKPSLCTFSKPVKNSKGVLMSIPHFGPAGWELPPVKAEP